MAPLPLACGLSIACPVLEVPGCITPVPLEFGSGAFMLPVAPCAKAPDANAVSAQVDTTVAILFMVVLPRFEQRRTNASLQKLFLTDLGVSSLGTSSISTAARKRDRPPPFRRRPWSRVHRQRVKFPGQRKARGKPSTLFLLKPSRLFVLGSNAAG